MGQRLWNDRCRWVQVWVIEVSEGQVGWVGQSTMRRVEEWFVSNFVCGWRWRSLDDRIRVVERNYLMKMLMRSFSLLHECGLGLDGELRWVLQQELEKLRCGG